MTTVSKEHIEKTPGTCGGRARIAGHRIRVMDIVGWHDHGGWSPARIVEEFPGITLADVYAALAYAHDHPDEIAADFEAHRAAAEFGRTQPSKLRDALARNPGLLDELRERFGD
ncbi:MAG: DUF433 domain-containing protein [Gemmataceae bacterium]|nr:DUF433 domain-containing protein [Gemmataceae bacterium]